MTDVQSSRYVDLHKHDLQIKVNKDSHEILRPSYILESLLKFPNLAHSKKDLL